MTAHRREKRGSEAARATNGLVLLINMFIFFKAFLIHLRVSKLSLSVFIKASLIKSQKKMSN